MKRISLLISAGLLSLATLAQAKTVPYASDMTDSEWTIVDVNNDGKTWAVATGSFTGTGYDQGVKYPYHSTNAANDWIISPAVTLTAGTEYKVKFWHKEGGSSFKENFSLYASTGSTPESLAAGTLIADYNQSYTSNWTKDAYIFIPTESGDYHFGFYAYSEKDKLNIMLTGFEVAFNAFTPATVSDFTVTPGANRALEATLTWTLPTTDSDGVAFGEGDTVSNVFIYRDNALVQTLDGNATTWTDNADSGLTTGKHLYEVEVEVRGTRSARASVNSSYIGPLVASPMPYDASITEMTKDDFATLFVAIKGADATISDSYNWSLYTSTYSANYIKLGGAYNKVFDNWLILPPMVFDTAGKYVITTSMSYADSNESVFDLHLSSGTTIESYPEATKVGTYPTVGYSQKEYKLYFEVTEPGTYNLAIHASGNTKSNDFKIYTMTVDHAVSKPQPVTNLTATLGEGNTVNISWTNPTEDNTGETLTADLSRVEIWVDGTRETTLYGGFYCSPGINVTEPVEIAIPGVHEITIVPYIDSNACENPASVYTPWMGDPTQALPYSCDFSDSKLHALWTVKPKAEGETTWTVSTSGATLATPTADDDYVTLNDVLMTAPFDLTEGYYKVTVNVKGGSSNYPLYFGLVANNDANYEVINRQKLTMTGYVMSNKDLYIPVTTAGKYKFAVLANEAIGKCSDIVLTKIAIAEQPVIPAAATDLSVEPASDLSLKATIYWINPTTCNIPDLRPTITKAEILRNGELITTVTEDIIAGSSTEYIDTAVPSPGVYTYTVKLYNGENTLASGHAEVASPWIGGGLEVPYEPENFNDWTAFNNATTGANGWTKGSNNASITSYSKVPDAWLISPPIFTEVGKKYILEVRPYNYGSNDPYTVDVYLGTETDPELMFFNLGSITCDTPKNTAEPVQFKLTAVEPGASQSDGDATTDENERIEFPAGNITAGFHASTQGEGYICDFRFILDPETGVNEVAADGGMTLMGNAVLIPAGARDITLATAAGQVIRHYEATDSVDLSQLAAGVYIVSGNLDGRRIALKVVK